jgi:serine/threonine-protein kinase
MSVSLPDQGDGAARARRWERIEAVFHEAAGRPAGEREAFVRSACGGDDAMRDQVMAMLAADAEPDALLDGGLPSAAQAMLGHTPSGLPRESFGPYRVTGLLGEGGMGVVYRGRRDDLGSEAAIKVLRDASLSPARRERFAFEQRVLAQLNHPAIARLYDADTLPDGTPWIAMELVEGRPITAYAREGTLGIRARLELFREVCEAVRYAHGRAILHRDLKPSNLLVRDDGHVKLLDFGISKSLESVGDSMDVTRTGVRLMTPAYAAPEQVLGGPLGVHTDVYSLGVVLYELLAGRLPFDLAGRTPSEAATILTEQPVQRPSLVARAGGERGAGVAEWNDLDVLCATAMHRDPDRRYPTVDALLRDVERFLAQQPLEARGDSWRYRAGKFVRRNAGAVTASATGFALLVAVVAVYTVRLRESRNAAQVEAQRLASIQSILTQTLEGGDEAAGPSDTLRVVTLLDGLARRTAELGARPVEQAMIERTLGGVFATRGQLDRADTLLTRAYAHTLLQKHPEPAEIVRDRLALSSLRSDQGRHDDAVRLARAAHALAEARLGRDNALTLEALDGLGQALVAAGSFGPALPILEDCARRQEAAGVPDDEIENTLTNLSNAHSYLGELAPADSLARLLLDRARTRKGPRHPDVANALLNLGSIAEQRGDYAAAERDFREALAISLGWYGGDHPYTADCLASLGRVLAIAGRSSEADSVLSRALAIKVLVYGARHGEVAGTLSALGEIAQDAGRLDDAFALHVRAADIYREQYGPHHSSLAIEYSNLGSIAAQRSNEREAERWYRRALEAYEGSVPPGNLNVGITRIKLGRALLHQERYAEAERSTFGGYQVIATQVEPSSGFLRAARTDLVAEYTALGRPEAAARFRAELADTAGTK